jgi:reductive dehalogenase
MSKFHTTVSRRNFMKGLGLGAAGLGAAAATAPVFHDLDELSADVKSEHKLPWYVKKVDKTTAEVDWSIMQRYDKRGQYNPGADTDAAAGYPNVSAQWAAEQKEAMMAAIKSGKSGAELKDLGIVMGSQWGWIHDSFRYFDYYTSGNFPSVLPGGVETPEDAGVARYQGTPEENAKMIRAAFSYFGAAHVTFQPIDSTTLKMMFANDTRGKPYVFKDVEQPYADANEYVIPSKCKWVISYLVTQNMQTNKTGESWEGYLGGAAVAKAYSELNFLQARGMTFLRTLGYVGVGSNPGNVNGWAIQGGMGELSRANMMIHPVYGLVGRVPNMMITDLPLPTGTPVDFGAFEFCKSCKKCAEMCPSGSISMDDEPSWETTGPWNAGGVKTWYVDWKKCLPYRNMRYTGLCGNCQGVCVFSKYDEAAIHGVVKAAIATTGIFNGFFRQMDDFFGYRGMTNEEWWDRAIPDKRDATHGRWW